MFHLEILFGFFITIASIVILLVTWMLTKHLLKHGSDYKRMLIRHKIIDKYITKKHRKKLAKYFPYYNKLSYDLKRTFEDRVEYYYFTKKFSGINGFSVRKKYKLLISAYAAQLTMGMQDYSINHLNAFVIHEGRFLAKNKRYKTWEIDHSGVIHISWKDFYRELNNSHIMTPIGLKVMSRVMATGKNIPFKNDLLKYRNSEYFNVTNNKNHSVRELFRPNELNSNDDFVAACLLNYFGKPIELKNFHPELFRSLDTLLYKNLKEEVFLAMEEQQVA